MHRLAAALLVLALVSTAPAVQAVARPTGSESDHARSSQTATTLPSRAVPRLKVTTKVRGLDHPWDVQPIGRGRLLITERDRARLLVWRNGTQHRVRFPSGKVWVSGETGLMSLAVDPRFARNSRFYTCQGGRLSGGRHDVRIMVWRLNNKATRATKVKKLLGGLPASTGRHGGCRLEILADGSLLVGTGDAAQGTNPEDLTSLGGKTLRLHRTTGKPWPDNPFITATNRRQRYVHTYGHRNVQGLAQRKNGSLWSIEQGPDRDDEVNLLKPGGDYGWNPVPGYNESVPMTDHSLPGDQVDASWSSGYPTLATSGGSWVYGAKWGALHGTLAVAALKAGVVTFLTFDSEGTLVRTRTPDALSHAGRLRSITRGARGNLWITTDNGDGRDVVLLVRPR